MVHRGVSVGDLGRWWERGAGGDQLVVGQRLEFGAQLVVGGHQRFFEGGHRLAVGLDGGVARELDQAQRLDVAVAELGHGGGGAGQNLASGVLCVDGVALALQTPLDLARWTVHLEHAVAAAAQEAGQADAVRAGALDPERDDAAKVGRPGLQCWVG
jgi:hypothetical protein